MDIDYYTKHILEIIEAIDKKDKFIIMGHSAGGRHVMNIAIKKPDKVDKLILISSGGVQKQRAKKNKRFINFSLSKYNKLTEKSIDHLWEIFKSLYETDLTPYLHMIKSPTLILWGEDDKVINIKSAFKLDSGISNSTLVTVHKVGHMIINTKICYDKILEFLNNEGTS